MIYTNGTVFACIWWDKSESSAIIVARKTGKSAIEILGISHSAIFFDWLNDLQDLDRCHNIKEAIFEFDDSVERYSQNTMVQIAKRETDISSIRSRKGLMSQFAARTLMQRAASIDGKSCPAWLKALEMMRKSWKQGHPHPLTLCLGMALEEANCSNENWISKI